jgi:hypothetical protein
MNTDELQYCHWDSSCKRKVRYGRARHARLCIQRILQSGDGLNAENLASYHCLYCAGFHVGHTRPRGRD